MNEAKKYDALLVATEAQVKAAKALHPGAEPEVIATVCQAAVEEVTGAGT